MPLPAPLDTALGPEPVDAGFCASNAAFTGRLTPSTSSTTAISRTTLSVAYGYISNVNAAWSCTLYYRYSGMAYNTTASLGTFRWGNLINSSSVACNYVVGSTDYVKGNATSDCPDSDAEYAMAVSLGAEGIFQRDVAHNSDGDFSFIQTDCGTYYGGAPSHITDESFATSNTDNRPGTNCDPLGLDDTGTTQTITYDATNPSVAVTNPAASSTTRTNVLSHAVTFNPTDAIAGFGGAYGWSLQRQRANISSTPGTCGTTWANDGTALTGTAQGSQTSAAQTLANAWCYRWILSAEDQNGNGPVSSINPGTRLTDTVAPTTNFTTPDEGTTTTVNTAAYSVAWTETEVHSGIASRSLQRKRITSTSASCPTSGYSNDGSASTAASPVNATLTSGYCYYWVQTLTDAAGNQTVKNSGKVYYNAADPITNFTTPDEGTTVVQSSTSYSVVWTENAGSGQTITSRSLQRERADVVNDNDCETPAYADVGSPVTTTSPVAVSGLLDAKCYRWEQTLTNSGGKTSVTTSGTLLIDTTPPVATITAPADHAPLIGDIVITGTAHDASSFKEYQLEYGLGETPGSWTTIALVTSEVTTTGTLATWSPGSLSGAVALRLTVRDNAGNTTVVTHTLILENAGRGDVAYRTRVPFDLGGGWGLDVGVHNGEARLSRELSSIPSYGPAQALGLSYSSLETGVAGKLGVGWSSNLTQYLTFDAPDIVVWHRADGGRVPFGKVGGVWTALAGHHETLALAGSEYTVTMKDQSRHVFESSGAGRLKRIEDRFANPLSLVWSTSSATVTDASGRVTTLAIDATNSRITGATDSAGRSWAFGYTGTGAASLLTTITESDPDGGGSLAAPVTTLAYTSSLLTTINRSRSRVTGAPQTVTWTIAYTGGKATGVTDPVAASTASTFTYGTGTTDAGILRSTGPVVRDTSTYAFDDRGRVTNQTDPLGFITTTTWDAASNPTAIAVPIGTGTVQSTMTYTYDAKGNVLTESVPIDGSTSVTTVNTYNATNDLLTRTDSDSDSATRTVTTYTYDGAGHLASVTVNCTTSGTTPPASGQGHTCTGNGTQDAATNLVTWYWYDANDQLTHEQDPAGRVTRYTYDSHGNQTSMNRNCTTSGTSPISPGQGSTCTAAGTQDAQTNVITSVAYSTSSTGGKAGLPTSTTDPLGRVTTLTYDLLGRRLTEALPGDSSIPALTRTTTYDELGNVLTETEGWTPIGGGSAVSRITEYAYDLANRQTSLTDPADVVSTTVYDLAGNATSSTSAGVTTDRTYDGQGRVLTESTPDGTTGHAYDAQGNEIETDPPEGEPVARTFTRTGWTLTETVDPLGADLSTSHTYDRLGRELTTTDPAGLTTTHTYDRVGRQRTSQVTGGPLVTTTYDRMGNAVAVLGADGRMTAALVDPLDRVTTSITNCTNSGTTVPAAGSTCAGTGTQSDTTNVTSRTWYDRTGMTIATQDPEGIATRTITNVRDLAATTIANCTDSGTTPSTNPPACVGAGTHTNVANVESTVTYDGAGAAISTITAVGTGATATTLTAFDAAGRVQAVKDPRGTVTRHLYDATNGQLLDTIVNCTSSGTTIPTTNWQDCSGAGTADGTHNLRTTYAYDAAGNQTSVTAPNGRETRTTYDADGRVATRTEHYVDGVPGTTDDLTTTYYYDDAGRQTAVLAPTSSGTVRTVTRYVYNADGQLSKEIRNCTNTGLTLDPGVESPGECAGTGTANAATNLVTEYVYDSEGRRVRVIAPDPSATSGTSTATVTTQTAYDDAGRLCRVVQNTTGSTNLQTLADPCSTATQTAGTTTTNVSTRYTYDAAGNLATLIDANGYTTTYGYDAAGRMTALTDPLGQTLVWVYDALGNRLRQENREDPPGTFSVQWTYDGAGRILTRQADGVTTSYTYDANGNQLTASDGTLTITTTYDRLDRPLTIDDEDAGTTADTTYTYSLTSPTWTDPTGSSTATLDPFDRPLTVDDPATTGFAWTWRADGQPTLITRPDGNYTELAYDASGRLTGSDTDTSATTGGTDRAVYAWTHNRAGQILTEASTITGDPSNGTVTYAYDPLARLTGSTLGANPTTTYGWDEVPNRTSVKVGTDPVVTTTYDAANRPDDHDGVSNAFVSDEDGRLTVAPGYRYEWDDLGRLTRVLPPTGNNPIATYAYDPLDRLRLVDHGGSDRVRFRYVGRTTSVAQWIDDPSGTVTRSVANGWRGERLADWTGSGSNLRIYGTNAHHDVTWLASSSGTVSQALRYDPWGTPRSSVPSGYTPFRFQGAWQDDATALSWVITRWYAPSLGRFISEDTLLGNPAEPPSRHLYAYGAGEPVGRWDPDGRAWVPGNPFGCFGRSDRPHMSSHAPGTVNSIGTTRCTIAVPFIMAVSALFRIDCVLFICWEVRVRVATANPRGGGFVARAIAPIGCRVRDRHSYRIRTYHEVRGGGRTYWGATASDSIGALPCGQ